jgi:Myb-like DNA-binding domain
MSKEVEINLKVLRKAAFEILDAYDDLSAVGSKQLRRECEQRLGLKSKVLDTAENKEIVNDLIGQYSAVYVARNRSGNANTDSDDYKKKKFSDAEKKLIMEVTNEFMEINGVDVSEICTCLRDIEDRGRKTYSLWKELGSLLPNRSVAQIRQHVQRALMREHAGGKVWTEEDKKTLTKLHGLYGANWNKIGRMMGFLDDDCKHMFHRLQGRSKNGKFSDEEDRQLVSTVRSVLGLGPAVSPADFPRKGIPWIAVAERLDNARLPLDYLRHWPYAVRRYLANGGSGSSSSSGSGSGSGGKKGSVNRSGLSALAAASGTGNGSTVMDTFTLRASKSSVQSMSDEERTRIVKWLKRLQEE